MRLLYDSTGGEGGSEAPPVAEAPLNFEGLKDASWDSSESVEATPEAVVPAEGSSGLVSPEPTPEVTKSWQSIRDASKELGYEFSPEVQDDGTALKFLLQEQARARKLEEESRRADAYRQIGEKLAPHAEEIQRWRSEQAKAAEAPPSYQPPPYDKRWLAMVEKNPETGLVVGKPGCPPAIVEAVNKRIDWEEKYAEDPIGMAVKATEERVTKTVEELFTRKFQEYQREQNARQIEYDNASWMYQLNQQGQVQTGYDGKPILTAMGKAYASNLTRLNQSGVRDITTLNQLARELTAAQFANQRPTSPVAPVAPARPLTPQARAMQNGPVRNALGIQPLLVREENPAAPAQQFGANNNDLRRALMEGLNSHGITDQDMSPQW
jgi:hypothetical protein